MKIYIIILSILITGCRNTKNELNTNSQVTLKFESVNQSDKGLSIESNNNKYKIDIVDSLFNYSISPDSSALLINHRVMSNIQVSQYYKLSKDANHIRVVEQNLSASAWDSISNKFSINHVDIINPKTNAIFTEDNRVKVQINGQTEHGIMINEVIEIDENYTHNNR